jgi:hypothetical protein
MDSLRAHSTIEDHSSGQKLQFFKFSDTIHL